MTSRDNFEDRQRIYIQEKKQKVQKKIVDGRKVLIRAGKKSLRLASGLGLGAARLGSERLASLERAEPNLFFRLAKIPSRAEPARSGSRAGSRAEPPMDHLSIVM